MNGEVEFVEDPVDESSRDHDAGVDCASDDSSQGIPGELIKPIMFWEEARGCQSRVHVQPLFSFIDIPVDKLVEARLDQLDRGSVVEPFMSHLAKRLCACPYCMSDTHQGSNS